VRRADNLTTFMCRLSWNLGASTFWNPQGLPKPVIGLLYLYFFFVSKPQLLVLNPFYFLYSKLSSTSVRLCGFISKWRRRESIRVMFWASCFHKEWAISRTANRLSCAQYLCTTESGAQAMCLHCSIRDMVLFDRHIWQIYSEYN